MVWLITAWKSNPLAFTKKNHHKTNPINWKKPPKSNQEVHHVTNEIVKPA